MKVQFGKISRLFLGSVLALSSAMAYGQSITIQGKVTDADGAAITGSTQFRVQIFSPDSNHCVLYDESRTLNLDGTYGLFSINVGASGGTRVAPTGYSLEQVLSNRGTFTIDGTYCVPSQMGFVNYAPASSDNRKLTIQFKTGSSAWETIPEMDLNPVPFAVDARNLGGFPATQVVRVSSGTAPLLSTADVTALNALLDGTSTKFVSNASGKGAQLPSFSSDPAGAPAGSVWFDSVSNSLKYRDNSGVVALSAAPPGGPITSVAGNNGLTGSGSSGAITLGMAPISGVVGSYGSSTSIPVITVDGFGRITVAGSAPLTGAAPTGAASGDLSGSFPGPTVAKIRGAGVSVSAPAAGQFYRFDDKGTLATTDDEWVPVSIRAADLKDGATGNLFPGVCAANQVFHFNGLTGGYDCGNIAGITSSQLATSGTLPAGGTFRSVTVDTKGLVTAGTNPTTIDDYAITDAVKNGGAVPKISSGSDSPSLPATALEGELFVATNSKKIYRYTTGAWLEIASAAGSGSLTDVLAGSGLSRSAAGSTVTLSLPSIAAVTNATKVSTDAFGRVTSSGALAASDIPSLDWSKITTGRPTTVATSGLTDAITNLNNAKGIAVGTAAPPTRSAATLNTFYINSATGAIYYDDGSNWQSIAAAPGGFTGALSGDVSGTQSGTSVDKIKGTGVAYTALTTGNFLRYSGLNWVNAMLSAADLPTVPLTKGGTGLATPGTADQFLSMKADASGLEYKSITAGTGVTVTPSAGGLQISAAGSGGTVTNVTASAPIVVANGASTPSLTIAKATAAVDGYLDKADFANFAGKLDASASFAGDVSGAYGATSVNKIKGKAVTYTSITSGNFLKYNGTDWVNANLTASDIGSGTLSASLMPAFTGDVTSTAGSTALTLGTVPATKGGTGLTALGTANQVLGVNNAAGAMEYKTITGGTGVTIGHTANTITINATGTGISSLNGATAGSQTFGVPGFTGLAPAWSTAGSVHTLNIPMASAASVTAGLLTKSDYDAFTAKLGTTTAFTGDVTGVYSGTSVDRLKGNPLSNTGLATGQFMRFGGVSWAGSTITLNDLVDNVGGNAMASAVCTAGQTMYYDVSSKSLKCQAISAASIASGTLGVANGGTGATTLTAGSLLVGAGTGAVTSLAGGTTGNIPYATSATAWSSGSPDAAGLVDKASAQTISGTKTFSSLIASALQFTGGTIGAGRVLTSDASGNATWQAPVTGISGTGVTNYLSRFTGTSTVAASSIYDNGTNVGIGTATADTKLHLNGTPTTTLKIVDGNQAAGRVLTSDASGIATWAAFTGITGSGLTSYLPKFTGTSTLANSVIAESSGNIGIGSATPATTLDVNGMAGVNASVEGVSSYVNTGATYAIPDTSVNVRRVTLTANATITLPAFASLTGKIYSLTLFVKQDATGSRTATFAGGGSDTIKWDSGTAPTVTPSAGRITILQFMKPADETVWYGSQVWMEATPCSAGSTTLTYSGSIVNFTVPAGCSTLTIEAWGAKGGYGTSYSVSGGLGAYVKGTVTTTGGTVYRVLVGQKGGDSGNGGGGAGGSFVATMANSPVMVAGGGGGSYASSNGQAGQITTSGGTASGAGGSSGGGGSVASTGSNGGAGFFGNGAASTTPVYQVPFSFVNGGTAGAASTPAYAGVGGFGGGAGAEWTQCGAGGPGGGYSGGGGSCSVPGAGGGSYISGTAQSSTSGVDAAQGGNGKVIFTYAQ